MESCIQRDIGMEERDYVTFDTVDASVLLQQEHNSIVNDLYEFVEYVSSWASRETQTDFPIQKDTQYWDERVGARSTPPNFASVDI